MQNPNKITFELAVISDDQTLDLEGIVFSNIAYIQLLIDNYKIDFEGSFIVLNSLKNSLLGTGGYLLFTGVSGIADAAGWDYIEVVHNEAIVEWKFEWDDKNFHFSFEKDDYIAAIQDLEREIEQLDDSINLEPTHVILPE